MEKQNFNIDIWHPILDDTQSFSYKCNTTQF